MAALRILVVGSINVDIVVLTERLPTPGETITGGTLLINHGGKGANQAVAARRLGADVRFIGCIGEDTFGPGLRQSMAVCPKDGAILGIYIALGAPIANYAQHDVAKLASVIDRVLEWDAIAPLDFELARAGKYAEAKEQTRSELTALKERLLDNRSTVEKEAREKSEEIARTSSFRCQE